ncbi:iron-containing alcohol dehydrogenase [Bordetella genomosp. 5]|uniref:4-hydroxybutyrate dehydrogenase n=1 Tax=Bordetella genomosp. 5 TaxID=1395608 RepID=A0A261TST8_9BORD|nr:iron-containing alcohol dehydrogenase [Bordetella genomosp. 5]OZI51693.1 4-hydroxybutyrate dehydrogenase [Bordetella genomosp. 5]
MADILYMTRILFERGSSKALQPHLDQIGITRPLLVTDAGIVAAGIHERVVGGLSSQAALACFCDTPPNPTEQAVHEAVAAYRKGNCDGILALGGGSPLDLAKGVAVALSHSGDLAQYAGMGASKKIGPTVPIVAVPTTAGTGSEVGRGALIILRDGRKLLLASEHLLPRLAVCDPELTLGLPRALTVGTGMDALTHCIETFLSPKFNPPADAIALDGLARAWRWIERASNTGADIEARSEMMMAGIQGGLAFQKGLGAVHALSHPLGALQALNLHHGTLNAVLLPSVLEFNAPFCEEKFDRIRRACDLAPSASLADAVRDLNNRLGVPSTLSSLGVTPDTFEHIVDGALADHSLPTNPRPLDRASLRALLDTVA